MTVRAAAAPRRGRPRSEQAWRAILDATSELLLEHGLAGASMDAVAERAGVSKATIYRWWPSKEALALEAVYRAWSDGEPQEPDTGSLRGDLRAILLPWARRLHEGPYGRVIAAFITEAQTDPAFEEQYRTCFVEPRRRQGRAAFARADARGEIPAGINVELALDMLYGPVYHRFLHRHAPLTDRFVADVIDVVLRGLAA
ncbi:MAG TPA: TetR/AcrR family transcriptional regulator [Acidimicrobiia bacterium]|nr:TetR/AcrR family transcriptional regulator [Acidimicrobiia bacterium]